MKAALRLAGAVAWCCGTFWTSVAPAQNHSRPETITRHARPPLPAGHLERPNDLPAPKPLQAPDAPRTRTGPWVRGSFVSIQVNVDAQGANIPNDAANEPSIAIDPTDHDKMVIGWRQFDSIYSDFRQAGWAYSHDAGQTWTFPGVIQPGVFRSDPVLDSDTSGNFYYNSLTADAGYNFWCHVFKSADGGVSWDAGTYAYGGDKQWMVIDHSSGTGRDNIYAYWTRYWSICYPAHFTRSYDGGASYLACIGVPGNPYWGTLAVGPDSELYVAGDGFVVAKSTTLKDETLPAQFDFSVTATLDGSIAFSGGPNPGGLLGQAWIAVDRSGGPYDGYVYLLCSVARYSTPDPLDVMFARSTDGGATWSDPLRINDDPEDNNAYQWFATMSVAPNGRIDAVWNDTRNAPYPYRSELYYAYSTDAGRTWATNRPVSPPFNPHLGWPSQNKIGDYYDMISDNEGADLAYAATFNGEQDVYYLRLFPDCNDNGVPDATDIAGPTSQDCGANGMPDECEPDCNNNGLADSCDIFAGTSADCNSNAVPDECDPDTDCNGNGIQDTCDLAAGTSTDCDLNRVPDECDLDCDNDGTPDGCQTPPGAVDLLQNDSSTIGAVVGPQGAPLAQDVHLEGPASLSRFSVRFRAVGSASPANLVVRFFNGSGDDTVLPDYPAGLVAEYVNPEVIRWQPFVQSWSYLLPERTAVPADLWVEVDFDPAPGFAAFGPGAYGVLQKAGPPATGSSHGLVHDRQNLTTQSPFYLDLSLDGTMCADCNDNGLHDACDLACDQPGGQCHLPGCGLSSDCNQNRLPDECEPDADGDLVPDDCDLCPDEPTLAEPSEPGAEVSCADGVDNDCDGMTDAGDADCNLPVCPYACGELDGSGGRVNLDDFATFAVCYGLSGPAVDCDPTEFLCSDLNGSGAVDLDDFSTFAVLFGSTPTNTAPDCLP